VQVKHVSSDFRSMGAQTKRVNFNGSLSAFQRVGNAQVLRPITMVDLMRESGLYTTQLQTNLMAFAPQYDNITPYGEATPNRQAAIIKVGIENKKSPLSASATYYRGQEVRGEGTTTLRGFERYEVDASFNAGRFTIKTLLFKFAFAMTAHRGQVQNQFRESICHRAQSQPA